MGYFYKHLIITTGNVILHKEQYKSNASYFWSETIIMIIMEFTYIMGISFYKVEIMFPQSLLHCQPTLSTFTSDDVCWLHKTLCWSTGALRACWVSSPCCPSNSIPRVPPWTKRWSQRVSNRDCRENEDLIHLPVWLNPSKFVFLTSLVCSSLLSDCGHLSSRITLTGFLHCPRWH